MPIRAENRARYPKDWKHISLSIRKRAGNQCECEGECGLHTTTGRCREINGLPAVYARGKVVLTVAHLNHIPEDCDPDNLRAMCQRCHLRYDQDHHAKSRRENRDRDIGQLSLLASNEGEPK